MDSLTSHLLPICIIYNIFCYCPSATKLFYPHPHRYISLYNVHMYANIADGSFGLCTVLC